jgi:hypothetical protein
MLPLMMTPNEEVPGGSMEISVQLESRDPLTAQLRFFSECWIPSGSEKGPRASRRLRVWGVYCCGVEYAQHFVGTGYSAVDTSIFTNFRLSDRFWLQFRAEAFKAFNRTHLQASQRPSRWYVQRSLRVDINCPSDIQGYRVEVDTGENRFCGARKRTTRLMFWATAARKNCSHMNFILRERGNPT